VKGGSVVPKLKTRGFEICRGFEGKEINIPVRATAHAAGYDFEAAEDIFIPGFKLEGDYWYRDPVLISTGVKAYMKSDEALYLYNRSSNPKKYGLVLANSVGVVDSDYYSNEDNDGHIMFAFYNLSTTPVKIKKGQKIGQGVFAKYLKADSDVSGGQRKGGFGSTGN
jgi:dUTP pyrophosphatase